MKTRQEPDDYYSSLVVVFTDQEFLHVQGFICKATLVVHPPVHSIVPLLHRVYRFRISDC